MRLSLTASKSSVPAHQCVRPTPTITNSPGSPSRPTRLRWDVTPLLHLVPHKALITVHNGSGGTQTCAVPFNLRGPPCPPNGDYVSEISSDACCVLFSQHAQSAFDDEAADHLIWGLIVPRTCCSTRLRTICPVPVAEAERALAAWVGELPAEQVAADGGGVPPQDGRGVLQAMGEEIPRTGAASERRGGLVSVRIHKREFGKPVTVMVLPHVRLRPCPGK